MQSYKVSTAQISTEIPIGRLTSQVCLGIGLLRLKSRMQTLHPNWKPTYLTTKLSVVVVSGAIISINIIILVMTALPTGGSVPNYYWPVTIVGFLGLGLAYWAVLRLLGAKGRKSDDRRTLGSKIGLEVGIYEEGDESIPEEMRFLMYEAALDGSRRRVQYKVCTFARWYFIGSLTDFGILQVSGPVSQCRDAYYKSKAFIFRYFGY